MRFTPTPLKGAFLIDLDAHSDERGFFARLFCSKEFALQGLDAEFVQANNSLSKEQGTLRGLHYQVAPMAETKLVRCIAGSLFDVILDLRPQSDTFGKWFGAILSQKNRQMMYVPKGFAHGFLTLEPNTELLYLVSAPYAKEYEKGIRWDDPQFAVLWPCSPKVISDKDKGYANFSKEKQ